MRTRVGNGASRSRSARRRSSVSCTPCQSHPQSYLLAPTRTDTTALSVLGHRASTTATSRRRSRRRRGRSAIASRTCRSCNRRRRQHSNLPQAGHRYSQPVEENVEPMVPTLMLEYVTEMLDPSASTCAGAPEVVAQVPRATPGFEAGTPVG
jgi:hypothetical protein